MTQASQIIAKQYTEAGLNKKNWGPIAYNVLVEGLAGDGVTDDTAALQALINTAIAADRRTILFPHGTYYVTALTNDDQVDFVGDNSSFTGGYSGTITDIGGLAALKAETVTGWFNAVTGYGADPTGATDSATAIQNAIDAAYAAGGGIVFLSNGLYLINSQIVVKDGVQLIGQGYTTDATIQGATTILKDGAFDGIAISGLYAGMDNITVDGAASNTGVGVRLIGGRSFIRNTTAMNQGGNGFEIGDAVSSKLNLWRAENILALANGGDGVYINSISTGGLPDANAGVMIGLDARGNTGDGLHIGNATANTLIGIACQSNTGYGIKLSAGATANYIPQPYTESNTAGEILLEADAEQNTIDGYRGGIGDGITDNGTGNYIRGWASQITGVPPYIKSPLAIRNLIIENEVAAGYYEYQQNETTKNLELLFQGSGSTPVRAILKHNNSGKLILQVQGIEVAETATGQPIMGIPHKEVALDFPSIPANSTADLTTTLTGVVLRDNVIASFESLPTGLVYGGAWVSATDTITVRLGNITGSAINPASIVWTIDVIQR